MRWWKIIGSIVGALAILLAVLFATPILGPQSPDIVQATEPIAADGPKDFRLFLNQNIWAGDGTVCNDSDGLTINITPNYAVIRMHIEIMPSAPVAADCPVSPGQFMYHVEFATPQTSAFSVVLPDDATNTLPPPYSPGASYITIHADMGFGCYTGTAYAASCNPITDPDCLTWPCANWAYYFPYNPVVCPD